MAGCMRRIEMVRHPWLCKLVRLYGKRTGCSRKLAQGTGSNCKRAERGPLRAQKLQSRCRTIPRQTLRLTVGKQEERHSRTPAIHREHTHRRQTRTRSVATGGVQPSGRPGTQDWARIRSVPRLAAVQKVQGISHLLFVYVVEHPPHI